MKVEDIISRYDLKPHPEGGFYKEVYRSTGVIKAEGFPNERNFSTSIYYLLSLIHI